MGHTSANSDVIVVGGGVIGLSVADALRRGGASVTLIERGRCGREASWAGAGMLHSGSWHRRDPLVQLQRESVGMYAGFTAELRDRTGIDCEHVQCGSIELLFEDQQLRMARSEVKAAATAEVDRGRPVLELLTPEQARQFEPAITSDCLGAKRCAVAGVVRNTRLLKALLESCRRAGVEIVEDCEAKELVTRSGKVVGVRTASATRQAGHVVLAAGCWSSLLDERLHANVPVMPVRGQVVMLRLPQPAFNHIIERGRSYLVPRSDGRVILGATQEAEAGYDKSMTAGGIGGLLNIGLHMVPELAAAAIEQTWAGLRPGTPDGRPHIGPVPELPGLIAATGHFRCGLTLAPITARIVADLILNGRIDRDLSRCQPGRPMETRTAASAGV